MYNILIMSGIGGVSGGGIPPNSAPPPSPGGDGGNDKRIKKKEEVLPTEVGDTFTPSPELAFVRSLVAQQSQLDPVEIAKQISQNPNAITYAYLLSGEAQDELRRRNLLK